MGATHSPAVATAALPRAKTAPVMDVCHRPRRKHGVLRCYTAYRTGDHSIAFPIIGAVVCFAMRIAGIRYGLGLPSAASLADRRS